MDTLKVNECEGTEGGIEHGSLAASRQLESRFCWGRTGGEGRANFE